MPSLTQRTKWIRARGRSERPHGDSKRYHFCVSIIGVAGCFAQRRQSAGGPRARVPEPACAPSRAKAGASRVGSPSQVLGRGAIGRRRQLSHLHNRAKHTMSSPVKLGRHHELACELTEHDMLLVTVGSLRRHDAHLIVLGTAVLLVDRNQRRIRSLALQGRQSLRHAARRGQALVNGGDCLSCA